MLVIGRAKNESIILRDRDSGERIVTITVLKDGRHGTPRIGITADISVAVYRAEIDPGDPPDQAAAVAGGNPEQNEPG